MERPCLFTSFASSTILPFSPVFFYLVLFLMSDVLSHCGQMPE